MKFLINDELSDVTGERPISHPREFHARLPGYSITPLHDLPEVARALRVGTVSLKDETVRMGLPAFKVLGASWAAYRELRRRVDSEPPAAWRDVSELKRWLAPHH